MTLLSEHCHIGYVSMVAKLKKKDRLNLTLMTLHWKPCQLDLNMVNDSPFEDLSHLRHVYGSQIKKKTGKT